MNVATKGTVQAAKMSGKIKAASLMIGITLTFFYNLPFELFGIGIAKFFLFFGTLMSLVSLFEYYNLNKKLLSFYFYNLSLIKLIKIQIFKWNIIFCFYLIIFFIL